MCVPSVSAGKVKTADRSPLAKADVAAHDYVLTPGRYVGAADVEDDAEPFEERMPKLVAKLKEQFAESAKLEAAIRANLGGLGL